MSAYKILPSNLCLSADFLEAGPFGGYRMRTLKDILLVTLPYSICVPARAVVRGSVYQVESAFSLTLNREP